MSKLLCWLLPLFLIGCASVKVKEDSIEKKSALRKPKHIYVALFDTTQGIWQVDRVDNELVEFKKNAALELQRMMLERFPEIAPTNEAPTPLPSSGLLVTGAFTRVNQGSRAMRTLVGFGAGGTKVETRVRIYDLAVSATDPVASFRTTGGSNAEPGLIGGGVVNGAMNAGTGLQPDWERTSREIRNFIIENFK